jgi:hypothetical protein
MPNLMIVDPCDTLEIEQAVPAIAAYKGLVYMRLLRGNVSLVLDEYGYKFEIGKAAIRKPRFGAWGRSCKAASSSEALISSRIAACPPYVDFGES